AADGEWNEAIAALDADPNFANHEDGKRFGEEYGPQLGLVPLGPDPQSGLQEFWDVDSGDRPERAADGKIVVRDTMGVVFVLLPGALVRFPREDLATGPFYFDWVKPAPELFDLRIDPFFVSKYEMTQGQWLHVTGANPSGHAPTGSLCRKPHALTHPVEFLP